MFKGSGSSKYSRACLGQYQHPLRLRCQPWNRRQYVGPLPVTRQDWDASWHSSTQHTALIVQGCRVRSRVKSESSALHGAQKATHSPSSSRNVAQPLIQHRQKAQGIRATRTRVRCEAETRKLGNSSRASGDGWHSMGY